MRSRSLFGVITFALLLTPCPADAGPLSDEDLAAVRALAQSYREAVLASNDEAVAALYAEDATEMPPHSPVHQGRAAILSAYEAPGATVSAFTMTSVETDGVDGFAYDRGTWTWTGAVEGLKEPVTDTGKYLCIARKQGDGSWLWTVATWNSNLPLPGQK